MNRVLKTFSSIKNGFLDAEVDEDLKFTPASTSKKIWLRVIEFIFHIKLELFEIKDILKYHFLNLRLH